MGGTILCLTDGADQLLRNHGLQVTAQRIAVLNAVSVQPHATADDVLASVSASIGSISLQTT